MTDESTMPAPTTQDPISALLSEIHAAIAALDSRISAIEAAAVETKTTIDSVITGVHANIADIAIHAGQIKAAVELATALKKRIDGSPMNL